MGKEMRKNRGKGRYVCVNKNGRSLAAIGLWFRIFAMKEKMDSKDCSDETKPCS